MSSALPSRPAGPARPGFPVHAAPSRRFGELLTATVPLSSLDVEEVLSEQRSNLKPFGQVAIELGLCTPEHIWQAWAVQLSDGERSVDLDSVGIDAQALYALPTHLAIEYSVIPVRLVGGILILATTADALPRARREIGHQLGVDDARIRFALASADDISRAIEVCYLPFHAQC